MYSTVQLQENKSKVVCYVCRMCIYKRKPQRFYVKAWLADVVRGKGHVRGFFKFALKLVGFAM